MDRAKTGQNRAVGHGLGGIGAVEEQKQGVLSGGIDQRVQNRDQHHHTGHGADKRNAFLSFQQQIINRGPYQARNGIGRVLDGDPQDR